jgi:hypothetical protein
MDVPDQVARLVPPLLRVDVPDQVEGFVLQRIDHRPQLAPRVGVDADDPVRLEPRVCMRAGILSLAGVGCTVNVRLGT